MDTSWIRNWVARMSPVRSITRDQIIFINSLALDLQAPKIYTGKMKSGSQGRLQVAMAK